MTPLNSYWSYIHDDCARNGATNNPYDSWITHASHLASACPSRPLLRSRGLMLLDAPAEHEDRDPAWSTTPSAVTYVQQKLPCPHNPYWSPNSPTIHHTRLLIFVRIVEDLPRPRHHPRELRYVLHKKTNKHVSVMTARSARCSPSLSRTPLSVPRRERSYHTTKSMLHHTHPGFNMLHDASQCLLTLPCLQSRPTSLNTIYVFLNHVTTTSKQTEITGLNVQTQRSTTADPFSGKPDVLQ